MKFLQFYKVYSIKTILSKNSKCISTSTNNNQIDKIVHPTAFTSQPTIGRTNAEQELLYVKHPELPENPKILKIGILGVPNSGKSTLVNRLMNRRISSVSSRINTTKNKLTGVLTDNDTQLIILDTPGLLSYKKQKKFKLDRQFIVDPHSSLWEADLVCVVHDVSDDFSRNRIDKEILKCLFANPEKESILILNKIDRLKNKTILLDLVTDLTGGKLNGREFFDKNKSKKPRMSSKSLKDVDYENLFLKTAEKMNIQLKDSKQNRQILGLLEELRKCEDFLIQNKEKIVVNSDQNETELISEDNRITLEKLKGEILPQKLNPSNPANQNSDLELINSIVQSSTPSEDTQVLRRIEDISPIEFKKDLLRTTDWHLYYKKLSALGVLVREKSHWPYFSQVFMISAKNNEGVDELKNYLFSCAKPGEWIFSRSLVTDQMPKDIAEMCVRERLLENFDNEVPYEVGIETAYWEVDENDCLNIVINLIPGENKTNIRRHKSVLFQNNGSILRTVKEQARQEIANTFHSEVKLRLIVIDRPMN